MGRLITALGLALGLFGAASARAADDPAYLVVGGGSWETLRDNFRSAEFDVAYRSDYKLWIFKPHAGLVVAKDGDVYGYTGLLTDLYWGKHVVTTISAAFGVYGGHGYNLGSHFEFRTGGEVGWRFDDASRLGVGLYHISNAGITRENGGEESVLLQYSIPLGHMFGN